MTRATVIICTFNREDVIGQAIEHAARQSCDADDFEVLVVDNASTDSTPRLLERLIAESPPRPRIRCVREARQGLSSARNRGAAEASGEVLIYLDDDALAGPDLVARYVELFDRYADVGMAGGEIKLVPPEPAPAWLCPELAGYWSERLLPGSEPFYPNEAWWLPYGANMAIPREVLRAVGGFPEHLGRQGKDFSGGEELDLAFRVMLMTGLRIMLDPRAGVRHVVEPHRFTLTHIFKSARAAARVWLHFERAYIGGLEDWKREFRIAARDVLKGIIPYSKRRLIRADMVKRLASARFHWEKVRGKKRFSPEQLAWVDQPPLVETPLRRPSGGGGSPELSVEPRRLFGDAIRLDSVTLADQCLTMRWTCLNPPGLDLGIFIHVSPGRTADSRNGAPAADVDRFDFVPPIPTTYWRRAWTYPLVKMIDRPPDSAATIKIGLFDRRQGCDSRLLLPDGADHAAIARPPAAVFGARAS